MDQALTDLLKPHRDQIDQIDEHIIELLADRQAAVKQVGALKKESQATVYDPKRELQARTRRKKLAKKKGLSPLQTEMVFEQIVLMARESQKRQQKTSAGQMIVSEKTLRVGVMGGVGSFSESATLQFLKEHGIVDYELHYPISTENVLQALDEEKVDLGIFPIENSTAGLVMESIQAMSQHSFEIQEIFNFDVIHCLHVLPGVKREDVQKVMSHPQALKQCKDYLKQNFPKAQLVEATDTAEGARLLEESPEEVYLAVIAPKHCAELYHLETLEEGIQDLEVNYTRFIAAKKSS